MTSEVIVRAKNGAATIRTAIQSIFDQDDPEPVTASVYVDGSSTDDVEKVVRTMLRGNVRVPSRMEVTDPMTLWESTHHSLRRATGDHVFFLDVDDLSFPGRTRVAREIHGARPYGVCVTQVICVMQPRPNVIETMGVIPRIGQDLSFEALRNSTNFVDTHSLRISKDYVPRLLEAFDACPTDLGNMLVDDFFIALVAAADGRLDAHLDWCVTGQHTIRPNSLTNTTDIMSRIGGTKAAIRRLLLQGFFDRSAT